MPDVVLLVALKNHPSAPPTVWFMYASGAGKADDSSCAVAGLARTASAATAANAAAGRRRAMEPELGRTMACRWPAELLSSVLCSSVRVIQTICTVLGRVDSLTDSPLVVVWT